MKTINYQGQEVQATLVNYLSGNIPTTTVDHDGDEELFRDERGRYYLRRTLNLLDSESTDPQPASGRTLVHRINVNAAILWATTRLNSETLDLRSDAASLLMEGRGYTDPHPSHLTPPQRELVKNGAVQGAATLELPFDLPPVHRRLLEVFTRGYGISAATLARASLMQQLQWMYGGHDSTELPETVRCIREYGELGSPAEGDDLETLLAAAGMTEEEAEGVQPEPAPSGPPQAIVGANMHRFTFEYPATHTTCGMRRTIEVSDEQMNRAGELAVHFDLAPTEFLRRLADHNNLPGQARRSDDKLRTSLQAGNIAFVCMEETMAKRIERAAQSRHQTVDEFVAESLGGDVDMWEENMLLHPVTGEMLEDDFETLFTETHSEMIVPPVGREHEPQFQTRPGRQRVRFCAYLTPEQLERLEFPHMVSDCESDEEVPTLLVPFDADACPFLEVDGQRIKIGQTLPQTRQDGEAAGLVVRLDAEASALVRRYLGVTPFDYTATDIVGGSVSYALEQAFDNQEEATEFGKMDSADFHDGAWGYVEEKIYDAQRRRAETADADDGRSRVHSQGANGKEATA